MIETHRTLHLIHDWTLFYSGPGRTIYKCPICGRYYEVEKEADSC